MFRLPKRRYAVAAVFLLSACAWVGWALAQHRQMQASIQGLADSGYQTVTFYDSVPTINLRMNARMRVGNVTLEPRAVSADDRRHFEFLAPWIFDLRGSQVQVRTQDIDVIARMRRLERLDIDGRHLTDADVAKLQGLRRLTWFSLYAPQVGDAGLRWLGDCRDLSWVLLPDSQIGDATVERIVQSNQIIRLDLIGTKVTSKTVELCGDLPRLHMLELAGTSVDDQCAPYIGNLRNVSAVDLSRTQVGDPVAAELARLPNLDTLRISNTQIGDAGVRAILAGCRSLTSLSVGHCDISAEAFSGADWPPGLRSLDLTGTKLSGEEILRICRQRKSLMGINTNGCDIDQQTRAQLTAICEQRRKPNKASRAASAPGG
jgi:hypothetical protein